MNTEPKKRGRGAVTDQQKRMAATLIHAGGITASSLAQQTGVNINTAKAWLRKHGQTRQDAIRSTSRERNGSWQIPPPPRRGRKREAMADKPRGVCRYDMDECGLHCAHPLHNHFYGDHPSIWTVKDGHRGLCIGCPCHEPQPDPTPDTCRWWKDEYGNWCCSCSDTLPDFTPWTGTDPNGCFCPKCGKLIQNDTANTTPTGGKAGHEQQEGGGQ